MLHWYPNHYRIGAAPAVTVAMVLLAIVARAILPGAAIFIWPLFATLPLVLILHLYLLIDDDTMSRLDAFFYALVHLPLAFVIWTFSLIYANGGNLL
ncbi:hypothetical protein [Ferrimonas gelatinilytica]|uniref:Uncharacterized protein n=1 Tax=Ferrimonas gelatinilytica TaxID=1255257 RepID=A0ABP9S7Z5_9GAMM